MSCLTRQNKYYSNKINIYNNSSFIVLPYLKTCPPPPSIYIAPTVVYPSVNPDIPPAIQPAPVPINYPNMFQSCSSCNK